MTTLAVSVGLPLPEGFALPPLPYVLGLLFALALVVAALRERRPTVDASVVLGFAPWMAAGSALHVLYVIGALSPALSPLAGTPAVYLTVGVLGGASWLAADQLERSGATLGVGDLLVPIAVAAAGLAVLIPAVGVALAVGEATGTIRPLWPAVGALLALPVTAVTWFLLVRIAPEVRRTGAVGVLVLFGHALDGISTAIGVDVLGFGERTPLSRVILDVGASLPTAGVVGSGWLFVVVKLGVACVVVALFDDYVDEAPGEALLLLGLIAAVGLGPGVHNLLLFAVTAG